MVEIMLDELPGELIEHIVKYLHDIDRTSLSLTCWYLHDSIESKQFIYPLSYEALINGYIPLFNKLTKDKISIYLQENIMANICTKGYIDSLKIAHNLQFKWCTDNISIIIRKGHLDCLKFIIKAKYDIFSWLYRIRCDNVGCLEFLDSKQLCRKFSFKTINPECYSYLSIRGYNVFIDITSDITLELAKYAITIDVLNIYKILEVSTDMEVLKYVVSKGRLFGTISISSVINSNNDKLLRYMLDHSIYVNDRIVIYITSDTKEECVKLLVDKFSPEHLQDKTICNVNLFDYLVSKGCLLSKFRPNSIEMLHKLAKHGYEFDQDDFNIVMKECNLECIKFIYSKLSVNVIYEISNVECLAFLLENGCSCTILPKNMEMVDYMIQHNIKFNPISYHDIPADVLIRMIESNIIENFMMINIESIHDTKVIKYLVTNGKIEVTKGLIDNYFCSSIFKLLLSNYSEKYLLRDNIICSHLISSDDETLQYIVDYYKGEWTTKHCILADKHCYRLLKLLDKSLLDDSVVKSAFEEGNYYSLKYLHKCKLINDRNMNLIRKIYTSGYNLKTVIKYYGDGDMIIDVKMRILCEGIY